MSVAVEATKLGCSIGALVRDGARTPRTGNDRQRNSATAQRSGPKLPDGNLLPERKRLGPVSPKAWHRYAKLLKALPQPHYSTASGAAFHSESIALLQVLPPNSIDLIITSPPYALLHKKAYGNEAADAYVAWF